MPEAIITTEYCVQDETGVTLYDTPESAHANVGTDGAVYMRYTVVRTGVWREMPMKEEAHV